MPARPKILSLWVPGPASDNAPLMSEAAPRPSGIPPAGRLLKDSPAGWFEAACGRCRRAHLLYFSAVSFGAVADAEDLHDAAAEREEHAPVSKRKRKEPAIS